MALRDLFELKGRAALITGGARGIGKACAAALAEMGADVALLDIHKENLATAVADMEALGVRAVSSLCDVTVASEVEEAFAKAVETFGRLDILVNSAGITIWAKGEEMTEEQWDRVIDLDLKGTFLCCQQAARIMIPQQSGSIINIASMSGQIVNIPQCQVAYNAAKAGVMQLTKSLAVEWAPHNIRVNSLSPGYTATEMTMTVPEYHAGWEVLIPMRRMARTDELLGAVVYLASDASTYTTGHDLVIDGAYTCL
ncbi:MAG: SDR family oxidoreductase [Armatimonadetes bacterium]|nr:SDR family oxidoreductase [Armatimonadota bacterium]